VKKRRPLPIGQGFLMAVPVTLSLPTLMPPTGHGEAKSRVRLNGEIMPPVRKTKVITI